jgi:large subunit ribosomal protein L10e
MALRPGRTIKNKKRPWTRVSKRKPRKSYVVGEPHPRIHVFNMGNKTATFETEVYMVSKDDANIRDNALEAARIVTSKHLETKLGKEGFFFKILIYPHNVLREKSIATGAGADRFSQGMKLAFGRPSGKAAIVKKGQRLFKVCVNKKHIKVVKEAFKRADSKIRCRTRVEIVE